MKTWRAGCQPQWRHRGADLQVNTSFGHAVNVGSLTSKWTQPECPLGRMPTEIKPVQTAKTVRLRFTACGRRPLWSAVAAATAFHRRFTRKCCKKIRQRKAVAAATALQSASRIFVVGGAGEQSPGTPTFRARSRFRSGLPIHCGNPKSATSRPMCRHRR